ncbi:MAG: signal peptidase II [Chloroflexi bacterium]|nr:signal peptidase II [Chloroflexota bacterium]
MSKLQGEAGKSIATAFPQGKAWDVVFLLTAILVVATDQLSKSWVRSFAEGQTVFRAGIFHIVHSRNSGAAFGMFQDYSVILTVVAILAIFAILALGLFFWRRWGVLGGEVGKIALGLILGGTAGNLTDRLLFGSVTDFIDLRFWPSFNVADSAITIGVILFIFSLAFLGKAEKR